MGLQTKAWLQNIWIPGPFLSKLAGWVHKVFTNKVDFLLPDLLPSSKLVIKDSCSDVCVSSLFPLQYQLNLQDECHVQSLDIF